MGIKYFDSLDRKELENAMRILAEFGHSVTLIYNVFKDACNERGALVAYCIDEAIYSRAHEMTDNIFVVYLEKEAGPENNYESIAINCKAENVFCYL